MKPAASILLVEDEVNLAETLQLSVQKLGYQVIWAKNLAEARSELTKKRFDLMILDRNLPDGDGIELLTHPLRKKSLALILSSKSALQERVKGLQAGADDYLPKPFSYQELAARLQALERRRPEISVEDEKVPDLWVMNPDTQQVLSPNGWISLTPLEYKFLSYLIERRGTIVSKDRLLKDVWGFSFLPKTRTIDYLMTQIRKRIEPNPEAPQFLLTIRGAGVKFNA